MKLPLLLVLLFRFPPKKLRRLELYAVVSFFFDPPATQNRTVEIRKQAHAAHSKPKLYEPILAVWWFFRKLSRPITYEAVISEAFRVWKNSAVMPNRPDR